MFAFPKPMHRYKLPMGDILYPPFHTGSMEEGHQCAPLPAVTVDDALSDLVCNIISTTCFYSNDINYIIA